IGASSRRSGHSAAHFDRCGGRVFLFAVIKTKSSATSNAAKSCFWDTHALVLAFGRFWGIHDRQASSI
ncbi:MAG: hypothetical protein WBF24_08695, partial [Xanthobacteraceae bacterium]